MSSTIELKPYARLQGSEVMCSVVFGTPSKNCEGSGVCLVSSTAVLERLSIPCAFVMAFVSFWEDGRLLFRFPKSGLEKTTDVRLFQTGFFLVEEAFAVPLWIMRAWGRPRIRIPPGSYPTYQTIDSWVVCFDVSE